MSDLNPLIRAIYAHYFKAETIATKEKHQVDLVAESLQSCLSFAKDFEICPYLVNRKTCYYIWHSIQETIGESNRVEKLTNNFEETIILAPQQRLGKVFTIEEFIIFFYHVCHFAFDNHPKLDARIQNVNSVKKLLSTLQLLEKSNGL